VTFHCLGTKTAILENPLEPTSPLQSWDTQRRLIRHLSGRRNLIGATSQVSPPGGHRSHYAVMGRNDSSLYGSNWPPTHSLAFERREIGKAPEIRGSNLLLPIEVDNDEVGIRADGNRALLWVQPKYAGRRPARPFCEDVQWDAAFMIAEV